MFKIQFDACNRTTLNLASIGFALYYNENILCKHCSIIKHDVPDSNYAEYFALIQALKFAINYNIKDIKVEGDAKIVLEQIQDKCNVKSDSVKPLCKEVKELLTNFDSIEFEHIYRKHNIMADSLANQALYDYIVN